MLEQELMTGTTNRIMHGKRAPRGRNGRRRKNRERKKAFKRKNP